jgi:hypothetical protein
MNVYWLQQFWFDSFINAGTTPQRNLLTIQFPPAGVNIFVNASLSAFGPGVDFDSGVVGFGGVGVRDFAIGGNPPGEPGSFVGHIELTDCTEVTLELNLTDASANANGMIYWFE